MESEHARQGREEGRQVHRRRCSSAGRREAGRPAAPRPCRGLRDRDADGWPSRPSRASRCRRSPTRPARSAVRRPARPTDAGPTDVGPAGRFLTTAQGARLRDTDHSLKAGARGPTLLQDHHLREKITHFDHERIPERVVHARGAGAHGVFDGLRHARR